MARRRWRLTASAAKGLAAIEEWTWETLGPEQADVYRVMLIARFNGLSDGSVLSQSCDLLTGAAHHADLRFIRAGQHFAIYREKGEWVDILELLHSRSDLPAGLDRLTSNPEDS